MMVQPSPVRSALSSSEGVFGAEDLRPLGDHQRARPPDNETASDPVLPADAFAPRRAPDNRFFSRAALTASTVCHE